MSETKTCTNCKHWYKLAVDLMGDSDVDVCYKIKVYEYDPEEDFPRLAMTEPDFGCTKFEPKGDLK